jgi:hypothetical protein
VTLHITPGVPHVFQAFHAALGEAAAALERAGQLLRAQLNSVAGTQLIGQGDQLFLHGCCNADGGGEAT